MLREFKLPDVGEGLTEGEILQWLVAVGDTVTVNQPLCEVETAKAAVELPSPYAGTVAELKFEAGTTVDVGTPIITIDVGGDAVPAAPAGDAEPAAGLIGGPAPGGPAAGLGGGGPRDTPGPPPPPRAGAPGPPPRAGRAGAPAAARPRARPPARPGPGPSLPEAAYGPGRKPPPLLATAPDVRTKPVRHGGLEIGRAAEAHAAAEEAAPSRP